MRLQEILTLEWDRVDLEKNRLFIPKHLTKTNVEQYVPITPTLRRELYRLRTQAGVIRLNGLVFQKNGKRSAIPTERYSSYAVNRRAKILFFMISGTVLLPILRMRESKRRPSWRLLVTVP